MALLFALAALAAAAGVGGWYWALICAVSFLLGSAPGLIWLAAFAVTGDRRLFFPFTLHYAVLFGCWWNRGFAAGGAIILTLFAIVRIEQQASFRVLAVELAVAAVAILAAQQIVNRSLLLAACVASLIAFVGLVL